MTAVDQILVESPQVPIDVVLRAAAECQAGNESSLVTLVRQLRSRIGTTVPGGSPAGVPPPTTG